MIIRVSNYVYRVGICRKNEAKAVDRDDDNVQNSAPNAPRIAFLLLRFILHLFFRTCRSLRK